MKKVSRQPRRKHNRGKSDRQDCGEKWKVVKDTTNFAAQETPCEPDNVKNAEWFNDD